MATDRYKYFRVEARDLLEQLGKGVLELDRGQSARPVVSRLLRLAHTLKGAARVVAQPEVALSAHSIEDLLEEIVGDVVDNLSATARAEFALIEARGELALHGASRAAIWGWARSASRYSDGSVPVR